MRDNAKSGALTEVTFLILLALYTPKHGYAVMQFINEKTNGRVVLGAGSLYGAINTLLQKKWIEDYGDDIGRKKSYIISPIGRAVVEKDITRLHEILNISRNVMEGE